MKITTIAVICLMSVTPSLAFFFETLGTLAWAASNFAYYGGIAGSVMYTYNSLSGGSGRDQSENHHYHHQHQYQPPEPPHCNPAPRNINLLEKLQTFVLGQPLANDISSKAVLAHWRQPNPQKALAIVLSGTTGVGKNYISSFISEGIFTKSEIAKHVHTFSGPRDFPDESQVSLYKMALRNKIEKEVRCCKYSIFIFDETDKMPRGIVDSVQPYIDYIPHINGIDFRHAIFLFLTNIGGKEINAIYDKLLKKGIMRKEMKLSFFENALRKVLYEDKKNAAFTGADMLKKHLIDYIIPFLPIDKSILKQCISNEMRANEIPPSRTEEIEKAVFNNMEFFNDYSLMGCKKVSAYVAAENQP